MARGGSVGGAESWLRALPSSCPAETQLLGASQAWRAGTGRPRVPGQHTQISLLAQVKREFFIATNIVTRASHASSSLNAPSWPSHPRKMVYADTMKLKKGNPIKLTEKEIKCSYPRNKTNSFFSPLVKSMIAENKIPKFTGFCFCFRGFVGGGGFSNL